MMGQDSAKHAQRDPAKRFAYGAGIVAATCLGVGVGAVTSGFSMASVRSGNPTSTANPGAATATDAGATPTDADTAVIVTVDPQGNVISVKQPGQAPSMVATATAVPSHVPTRTVTATPATPGATTTSNATGSEPSQTQTPGPSTDPVPHRGTSSSGSSTGSDVPGSEHIRATGDMDVYDVQPGDTLSRVSRIVERSVQSIAKANDIDDVNLIYAGSTLVIP